jgi:nitrite reductase/ring-hydroxylating ferredoxin subunit
LQEAEQTGTNQEPDGRVGEGQTHNVVQHDASSCTDPMAPVPTRETLSPETLNPPLATLRKLDLTDGQILGLDVTEGRAQRRLIVIRRGDEVIAFENRCPHAGWPLDTFDGRFLTSETGGLICAAHMAVFDPKTGACLGGPGQGRGLTPVAVRSESDSWVIGPVARA